MGVLELGAIHFDHRSRIAEQNFSRGFHYARFSGACGPQKQQITYRASRRIQAGAKYLVEVNDCLYRFVLADDLPPQP
jgi:hypothetical protein